MNTLQSKQAVFAHLVAQLIYNLNQQGYDVTFGEAYRPPETADLYAKQGRGIAKSLHTKRLAIDLNLFLNGKYLTETDEYLVAGLMWEGYSTKDIVCCWGGRFKDGNHFSVMHDGIK